MPVEVLPMVNKNTRTKTGMIYSPVEQIPIGIPIITADGKPAIRMKYTTKRNQHKIEDIPLEYIFAQTINAATTGRNSQTE